MPVSAGTLGIKHYPMNIKNTILSLWLALLSLSFYAQTDPGWPWAKRGGGPGTFSTNSLYPNEFERIVDLAVDTDDNYYFLAEISGAQYSDLVGYDDQELDTYNSSDDRRDIYVFSTDSEGNFRWDKMIGGGHDETATSINIDEENNVYVSGTVFPRPYDSIYFDQDTIIPPPEDPYQVSDRTKGAFIIKYNQEGNYQWLQQPEGPHSLFSLNNFFVFGYVAKTVIEPNGNTHSLILFPGGTHLNGQLEVEIPEGELQATVMNYDSSGNLISFFEIDMKPLKGKIYDYQLAYDSNLDRYYIADTNRKSSDTISINGYGASNYNKGLYLAAVDNQGEVLWYHESTNFGANNLGDIQLDSEGNIYFTGGFFSLQNQPDSFAGYEFIMNGSVGSGEISPFLIKLNPDGTLIWGTNPESYSRFPGQSIAIQGNEVYLGLGMLKNTWGDLEVPGPEGAGLVPDPIIMHFNAQTGEPLEVISTPEVSIYNDQFTALGIDSENNLIAGGFFGNHLFYEEPFAIFNSGGPSDFFIAKYRTDIETNPCAAPTDLAVENLTPESANVTWTPGGEETQWEVAYGTPGFDPEIEGETITVNNTPQATLEDLEPQTNYIVYVRAVCEDDGYSDWSGSVSFTTGDLGVEEQNHTGLSLYPNPTDEILHLESEIDLESYKLFDLQGRIVQKGSLKTPQLNLSKLGNGLYILQITTRNGDVQNLKVAKR